MASKKKKSSQGDLFDGSAAIAHPIEDAPLSEETRRRYLHYALSVITARALPDVRDGLKPVQRRILYAMHNDLHLRHDAKYRKCALIVGDVMGKYHPHGDSAIYDALVRMAQHFSLRAPLVDGRGNFGSPDGDAAAAMRYTEARLRQLASEMLGELGKRTVPFRPNYDGTRFEPVVLPSRFPNLLVNGVQGIAVGMATSIPPHNLGEVIDAAVALIDDPDVPVKGLLKFIKGPDFPTGGQLLSTRKELLSVYTEGSGSLKLRGEWKAETPKRGNEQIVITSIPYAIKRASLVEKIAEVIIARKLPALLDVRDESTDETRIVLEIKKGTDPQLVMAYLYKHTPMQTGVSVDLTCLVPTENPEVPGPSRLDLAQILRHFLDFRMDVVTKRLEFDLEALRKRIHILEGFAIIFDALDETIRIIRRSDGKKDAAAKLIKRFSLTEEQVEAILELKLYRLAKLEILLIREELEQKRAEATRIERLLKSPKARWKLIRGELLEIKEGYNDRRRTRIVASSDEPEFDAEAFILEEDAHVMITRQGWIKRQREIKDVTATRTREGDAVLDVAAGSTKSVLALFSNMGTCYVCRVVDVPATTGYGTPVQKLFKLADGERIVSMMGFDPRVLEVPPIDEDSEDLEGPYAIAVTKGGMTLCMSLRGHREPSTRAGRRYMRLSQGDEVLYVGLCGEEDYLACASKKGRALICDAEEVSLLAGPGKGVMLIKLDKGDELVGAQLLHAPSEALQVEKESGASFSVSRRKYQPVSRGGKGHAMFKRGSLKRVLLPVPEMPELPEKG
ncbi:MAG: DNA topoisomerase IV subunit A [Myxococcales bacterium]|nr:DNA topoisomerase IV subunit A [Myxococcales bacterium]MDD9970661.1 DNA topoisomerase IV subunit A [Myxococcales bacterium]